MSEVSDATQIIVVAGRAFYMLGKIDLKLAMQIIKLINTVYLSKWKGKAGLGRLRQIKGDDLMYLNVGSENKADLKKIEREMRDHGILFARMPDLCGGDGRTQYTVAVSDAAKVRALLIDHPQGKNKDISIGMLSEKEYFSTAFDKDGKPTPEMWDLAHSQPDPAYGAAEPERTWSFGRKRDDGSSLNPGGDQRQKQNREPSRQQGLDYSRQFGTPEQQVSSLHQAFGDVRVRMRDLDSRGLQSMYQWIPGPPRDVQKRFAEFTLDGTHSVFVPIEDAILPGKHGETFDMNSVGAALFQDKSYTVADLQNATFHSMTGTAVLSIVKQFTMEQQIQGSRSRDQVLDPTLTPNGIHIPEQVQSPLDAGPAHTADASQSKEIPYAQSGVKPAVPEGVVLNGIPGAKSLDAPAGRSL